MKKFLVFALGASMLGGAMSCSNGTSNSPKTLDDSLSYYFGSLYGTMVKQQIIARDSSFNESDFASNVKLVMGADTSSSSVAGLQVGMQLLMTAVQLRQAENMELNLDKLYKYMNQTIKSDTNVVDMNTAQMQIQRLIEVKKSQSPEALKNVKDGEEYLAAQMAADPEIKVTESGLAYKVIKEGDGNKFITSDRINVIYTGTLIDGKEFDSSKGEARTFTPAGVVPGFKEGLLMMSPGAEYILYIPGKLAYGVNGSPQAGIGPNAMLIFNVQTPSIFTPVK